MASTSVNSSIRSWIAQIIRRTRRAMAAPPSLHDYPAQHQGNKPHNADNAKSHQG